MAVETGELETLWLQLRSQIDLLASERQQYLAVFEQSSEAYVVTDAAGTIEAANGAAVDILQRRRAVLLGRPLATFVALDRRKDFRERLARLASGHAKAEREWCTVFEAPGVRLAVAVCARPIGAPSAARGICLRLQGAPQ